MLYLSLSTNNTVINNFNHNQQGFNDNNHFLLAMLAIVYSVKEIIVVIKRNITVSKPFTDNP